MTEDAIERAIRTILSAAYEHYLRGGSPCDFPRDTAAFDMPAYFRELLRFANLPRSEEIYACYDQIVSIDAETLLDVAISVLEGRELEEDEVCVIMSILEFREWFRDIFCEREDALRKAAEELAADRGPS